MNMAKQPGSIEVICGSMFSGKSEELIRRVRLTQFAKQSVIVFKPKVDDRYSVNEVVTHNGTSVIAQPVSDSTHILHTVDQQVDVVAIDEAQFFDDGLIQVVGQLADLGHRVIVAGLDQDFRGKPFGPMPQLMAIAEKVSKLQAVCMVCGSPASRTQRLINGQPARMDDPTILVGADESYEARCRQHHEVPLGTSTKCSDSTP